MPTETSAPLTGPAGRQPSLGFGRVAALVLSSIGILVGFGLTFAGGTALVLDLGERDSGGYLMTTPFTYSTRSYALVSDSYRAGAAGTGSSPATCSERSGSRRAALVPCS